MNRHISLIIVLPLCVLLSPRTRAQSEVGSSLMKAGTVILTVIGREVTDNSLKLRYAIINGLKHDVWICETISICSFEAYLAEDGKTLMVRRRLDVPLLCFPAELPIGRYIRLRAGERRIESLWLPLPVNLRNVFSASGVTREIVYPEQLTLEIGYYVEDLPMMVYSLLEEAEKTKGESTAHDLTLIMKNIKGSLYFNELNEGMTNRDDQVLIPYTDQGLKGEEVIKTTVDNIHIPYIGKPQLPNLKPPDFSRCTRIEIRYEPSMLEYFFPYPGDQDLFSVAEVKYLNSLKTITVEDQTRIKEFAGEIGKGFPGGITTEQSTAHVVCYHDGERITSFTVYDERAIITEDKQLFSYARGLRKGLRSTRTITPQIHPFDLRVRCASNLNNLWHRLSLYNKAEKMRLKDSSQIKPVYPKSTKWCDAMTQAYKSIGMLEENIVRTYKCPSAGKGKCHYAINPNSKYDSPPDMVLLFETKVGWNQHGGPELFTFDNHDPKGGCVLLNDGTVKFIRTKEELQQLRWK